MDKGDLEELIIKLHALGVIELTPWQGSGVPFLFHFPYLLSHPLSACRLADCLWEKMSRFSYDYVVPGLSLDRSAVSLCLATQIGWSHNLSLVHVAHREKGVFVEGMYKTGGRALVVQETLAHEEQLLEQLDLIEEAGLVVLDVVVFIDLLRSCQKKRIKQRNVTLHCVISIRPVVEILMQADRIAPDIYKGIEDFFHQGETS